MIAAAFWSSEADSGARGCDDTDFALRGVGSVASSVDMFCGRAKLRLKKIRYWKSSLEATKMKTL
jgi:hypothetical protein